MKLHPIQNMLAFWLAIEAVYGICIIYFGIKRAKENGVPLIGVAETVRGIVLRMFFPAITTIFFVESGYKKLSKWKEADLPVFGFATELNVYLAIFLFSLFILVVFSLPNWISDFCTYVSSVNVCQVISLIINGIGLIWIVQFMVKHMSIPDMGKGYSYLDNAILYIYMFMLAVALGAFTFRKEFSDMSVPDKIFRVVYLICVVPAIIVTVVELIKIAALIIVGLMFLVGLYIWLWARG